MWGVRVGVCCVCCVESVSGVFQYSQVDEQKSQVDRKGEHLLNSLS